jgi:hypothetical protein
MTGYEKRLLEDMVFIPGSIIVYLILIELLDIEKYPKTISLDLFIIFVYSILIITNICQVDVSLCIEKNK